MHRAQMSLGTIKSVAQHAHVQTVSVHWPSTGIGTSSSAAQVHLSLLSLASHCAMAVYCTVHCVLMLAVASASFTQLVWQSGTGQSPGACDAHIAVQACPRLWPVPEPPDALPPAPPPPEPPRGVPPAAVPVTPPEPDPPLTDGLPPLPGVPPRVPVVAVPATPPETDPPLPDGWPPLPGVPPREDPPPLELPSMRSDVLLLLEQANANSIAAGRMRKTELVLCMGRLSLVKG